MASPLMLNRFCLETPVLPPVSINILVCAVRSRNIVESKSVPDSFSMQCSQVIAGVVVELVQLGRLGMTKTFVPPCKSGQVAAGQ